MLFCLDAERAHSLASNFAKRLQSYSAARELLRTVCTTTSKTLPRLRSTVFDIDFKNPIGIAAGFDKNAELIPFISDLDFGFIEIGSVSNLPCQGNPKPRLFRLPADSALINRLGLNNIGADLVAENLKSLSNCDIVIGASIVKTHDPDILDKRAIIDIVECYKKLHAQAHYFTLNVSCPNTSDGKTFEESNALKELLTAIASTKGGLNSKTPLLVKFSADIPLTKLEEAISVCEEHSIDGYVLTNTTTSRPTLKTPKTLVDNIGSGGLSGKPLFAKSIERVRFAYSLLGGKKPIIGVGGIDSAASAYAHIKAGASLLQLYTGLVYEGPLICKAINYELNHLLLQDGFATLREAVGSANEKFISGSQG